MVLSVTAIVAIVVNIFLSIILVLLNKGLVVNGHFHFMTVLSGLHFASSFAACLFFMVIGFIKYKPVNNYLSVIRISLVCCSSSEYYAHTLRVVIFRCFVF
jgi:hypothetical protein